MTHILLTMLAAAAIAWPAAGTTPGRTTGDTRALGPGAASSVTVDKDGDDDTGDDGDDGDPGHGAGDKDAVAVTGVIPPGSLVIDILDDDGYTPATLEIDVGQQVTWVNQHHDEHTATGAAFDTQVIEPGATATITFDTPGRFAFACQFHEEMTGIIGVRGSDGIVPEPSPVESAPPEAQPIVIDNRAFAPPSLSVPVGTTVVWTDASDEPHTVTAADGSFGSDILLPGDTFPHTFDTAGTFRYACRIHDEMQGVIVVEPGPGGSAAPPSPEAVASPA